MKSPKIFFLFLSFVLISLLFEEVNAQQRDRIQILPTMDSNIAKLTLDYFGNK